jgi:hypothetical protein
MAMQEPMPASEASGQTQFFDEAFDAFAEETLDFYHVPGLAVGIVYNGKTYAKVWQLPVYSVRFGRAHCPCACLKAFQCMSSNSWPRAMAFPIWSLELL